LGNTANLKLVHTHPSNIIVAQARNALELAGVDSVIRNEYSAGALGELAPIDVWPELWILRDRDYERAKLLLAQSVADINEADWRCRHCGSDSPATFELCWHCAGDRTSA
jgi:hypothetical protein